MKAGPGSEPGSHCTWLEASAIPPFLPPLCDHSLKKFSKSRMNRNGYFFSLEFITLSVLGKQRLSEKGR